MTRMITSEELKNLLKKNDAITFLDVRRNADYEAEPIQIPLSERRDPEAVDAWSRELPKDRPAVVYCVRGGSVSRSVADKLAAEGLDAVILEGGFKAWVESGGKTGYTIRDSDIRILKDAGMNEADLDHSIKVAKKALEIADRTGASLDMELVVRGALFHDLGKTKTHGMTHGRDGYILGKTIGLPEAVLDVMEKHIRGGLTETEAIELGLPVKDYTLSRLEERVIIYADRLVDIIYDGIVPLKDEKEAEEKFEEILTTLPVYGKNQPTLERYLRYHQEIQALM